VLVVDDERRYVEAHARMLREEYTVETAGGGQEALDVVDEAVDVVLLDRQMPGLDGDEVASKIRDREIDCRIVLLTAVEPDVDIIELGIDDYLIKPAGKEDLSECIEELLEWNEYDNPMQDFFALSNKREVLLEEGGNDIAADQLSELEQRITQKAEEGLQKNREVLETLIQSSPAAIVTLDTEGKVDIWNPSAEDLFEWETDEVIGELPPIFTEDARDELETIRSRLFADAIVTDLDIECMTRSGAPLDVSLSAAPLYDNERSMYGMMFVMMDITDRKQREQRLNVLSRVLRHNLRNDLAVILGHADVVREEVTGTEADHMEKLIDTGEQLLQSSEKARDVQQTLDAGENDVEHRDIATILSHTVTRAERDYPAAETTVDIQTDETTVIASEGLSVAIWNLVENAIEHNDSERPTVEMTVTSDSTADTPTTTVAISDDGLGIPQQEATVIDRGTEDALSHGSGLGLWVIKWILDRSGADLAFETTETDGTTATVTLRRTTDGHFETSGIGGQ
jgi:PAS domain S-box-containing protein